MARLLVVDDEPNVLYSLEAALANDEFEIATAQTGQEALAVAREKPLDAIIVDVRLPDMSGLDLIDRFRQIAANVPIVVMTAYAATGTAIEAMKRGAFEYLLKPVDLHELRRLIRHAVEFRKIEASSQLEVPSDSSDGMVGQSPPMQEVYKAIGRIAAQDVTTLILGESGTGKELVARAIHQHSKRANRPFLAINCAAIPETLLESELFGHEKGAFTGADRQQIGKFERADRGTLFLDEIGELAPAAQAKLLRLLQEQQFERVGGRETLHADVRILAATNHRLEKRVASGDFRQDLYYRINGYAISIPPLRARKEDIPELVDHFLRSASSKLGKQVRGVAPEAMRTLERFDWPGNVRELQNAISYAVIHSPAEFIGVDGLPPALRGIAVDPATTTPDFSIVGHVRDLLNRGDGDIHRRVVQLVEQIVIAEVLQHVRNNQVHASELLGISRTTLRNKLASEELRKSI